MFTAPYIDGSPVSIPSESATQVMNPATQKPFASVFLGDVALMRRAIDAADNAKAAWGKSLAAERELILQRAADVLESMRQEVVDILIGETGSTFGKSQFEVSFTVNMLRAVAGEARRIHGDVIPSDVPGLMSAMTANSAGNAFERNGCASSFSSPAIA